MRISDWSSDVCSSDLGARQPALRQLERKRRRALGGRTRRQCRGISAQAAARSRYLHGRRRCPAFGRSEEHTSELQSLMRISYAVFCLKKKKLTIQSYSSIPYTLLKQK